MNKKPFQIEYNKTNFTATVCVTLNSYKQSQTQNNNINHWQTNNTSISINISVFILLNQITCPNFSHINFTPILYILYEHSPPCYTTLFIHNKKEGK